MTTAARAVLADCIDATDELVDGVQGGAWRRRWINAVVLLRTVGYILDNIDGRNPEKAQAIADAWERLKSSRPNPPIFWQFIDDERNSILKEYRISAGQGATVRLSGLELNLATGEVKTDARHPTLYHYTINSGPFAGRDQRDLLREAIEWWKQYLDQIDLGANQRGA